MSAPMKPKAGSRRPVFQFLIDEKTRRAIDRFPEVNWSEVCRRAVVRQVERLRRKRRK